MRQKIIHSCGAVLGYYHGVRATGEPAMAADFEFLDGTRATVADPQIVQCPRCYRPAGLPEWVAPTPRPKSNIKFKLCSPHKACSFCGEPKSPVVMEIRTGKAICERCIEMVAAEMVTKES